MSLACCSFVFEHLESLICEPRLLTELSEAYDFRCCAVVDLRHLQPGCIDIVKKIGQSVELVLECNAEFICNSIVISETLNVKPGDSCCFPYLELRLDCNGGNYSVMVGIGWCLQSPLYTVRLDDFDVTGDDVVEFLLC